MGVELGYKGLKVYQLAYRLVMEIFEISKTFPKEETYSRLYKGYEEVGRMLGSMVENPEKFLPRK